MEYTRTKRFERNEKLEKLLEEINGLLAPIEAKIMADYRMPRYPVIFVVGVPRCGSTLMMQWLANTGRFAYPTNLLSRFFRAPFIGAKIQQLLADREYSFRDEILDFAHEISFTSSLGKTTGALSPNEFWYFWRRFIPITEPSYMDDESLNKVKAKELVAELAAIEAVFDKPLTMKGTIVELNIPFLSGLFDKALFLFVRRDPFFNIQSLLESREKYFGHRLAWYSIRPREYVMLKNLDPIEQVAGQVYFTNRAIEDGLSRIEASRKLVVDYESFCQSPEAIFVQIVDSLGQQNYHAQWKYAGPEQFRTTNQIRVSTKDCERIAEAYRRFSGEDTFPVTAGSASRSGGRGSDRFAD
jgi:hypothetical protein